MKAVLLLKFADEDNLDEAKAQIHNMLYGKKQKEKPPSFLAKAKGKMDGLTGFRDEESSTSGGATGVSHGKRF